MNPRPRILAMMAKYWFVGDVKTRLAAKVGLKRSADLHRLFVLHLGRTLIATLGSSTDHCLLSVTPESVFPLLDLEPDLQHWRLTPQSSGDLGERMSTLFRLNLQSGEVPANMVLVGTDCPTLTPKSIEFALNELNDHEVVLGPAQDGGYYLIGLRGPWDSRYQSLFEGVPWSTESVFNQTLDRAILGGLRTSVLPLAEDIDTIECLNRLREMLAMSLPSTPNAHLAEQIEVILAENVTPKQFVTKKVVIVGGGVIGLGLAWELASRGAEVELLEQHKTNESTSRVASGILPPANLVTATDSLDQLRGLSHKMYPSWADRLQKETGIDIGLRRCGGWYLADSPGERATMIGMADYWRELEIECVQKSVEDLKSAEPALSHWLSSQVGITIWWVPDEYQVCPPALVRALHNACVNAGVKLREQTTVYDLRFDESSASVRVGDDWSDADAVVVCGGAETGLLTEKLRLAESLVPIRGQLLVLKTSSPLLRSVINIGNRYILCRDDGHTIIGSCEEEVGFDRRTTSDMIDSLREFATSVVPELRSAETIETCSGLRPLTFDGFPMIGRVPETQRVFVAAGHYRSGIHLAPGTSTCLADQILNLTPPIDLAPFRVGKQQIK